MSGRFKVVSTVQESMASIASAAAGEPLSFKEKWEAGSSVGMDFSCYPRGGMTMTCPVTR